jgi:parvulin-like peptidyl-prolyl isomerase
MRVLTSLAVGLFVAASPAGAQDADGPAHPGPGARLVDRVVAVVGDSAIFHLEVKEQLLRIEANGVPIPEDSTELRAFEQTVLDDLIAQSLILQAAARDTLISVPDDQVDAELEAVWAERVRSLGSEEALRQAVASAGMTPAQYRASLRQQIVEGQLTQQYMQSQVQATRIPPIEEAEIREVFDRDRSTFGNRPATIAFRQVILVPEPSDSAKAEARAEAERVLGLLQDGGDFADLARRFSADAGSAQAGGNLGWVRQGDTVREFEDALFSLPRGGTESAGLSGAPATS